MSDKPVAVIISQKQGVEVPNIAGLSDTTKDWVFQDGLHRPRPPVDLSSLRFNPTFLYRNPWSTSAVFPPIANTPTNPPSPPPLPLPTEKREMPVVGYRAWGFSSKFRIGLGRDVALKSTGVDHHWSVGANHATCNHDHAAPQQSCHCGYYVLASLDEVEKHQTLNDGVVVGAVMGWGKVVQHGREGWRAEFAKIIALLDCKYSKGQLRNTQQAATAYGVEVKTRDALEYTVREFGDPFAVTP